jgi:hypothetical protein
VTSENPTDDKPVPPSVEANQNSDDKNASPPSSIPPGPTVKVHTKPSHSCYEVTCKTKRDGWDYAKFVAELVGLGFLIAYTIYTAGIYCANKRAAQAAHDTLGQIQQQTALYRQQLEATQAAVIQLFSPPRLDDRGPALGGMDLYIRLKNTGRAIAHGAEVRLEITKREIPSDKILGVPIQWNIPIGEFIQSDDKFLEFSYPQIVGAKDAQRMAETRETLRIDGAILYDNGFSHPISQPICLSYIHWIIKSKSGTLQGEGIEFDPCGVFRGIVAEKLRIMQEHATRD